MSDLRLVRGAAPLPFFHGRLSRAEAEALLQPKDEGAYLLRLSSTQSSSGSDNGPDTIVLSSKGAATRLAVRGRTLEWLARVVLFLEFGLASWRKSVGAARGVAKPRDDSRPACAPQ